MGVRTKKKDRISPVVGSAIVVVALLLKYWYIAVSLIVILLVVLIVRNAAEKKERQHEADVIAQLQAEKEVLNQRLLAVQNAISPIHSDTLTGTPKQIEQRFHAYISNHTTSLNDASQKMNKADNPKSFFEAADKYKEEIEALCKAENQDFFPIKPLPSDIKKQFEQELPENINSMIIRMWKSYQEQAVKLKTDRGKKNRIRTFFDVISLYSDKYYSENLITIRNLGIEANKQYGLEG